MHDVMKSAQSTFAARQSGAVMIVSLLLLLVMTVLALAASQATRMQEKMAGNARDHDLALQSSEAGLRAGEGVVAKLIKTPAQCTTPPCAFYEAGAPDKLGTQDLAFRDDDWWNTNAKKYATADTIGGGSGKGLAMQEPTYLIEYLEDVNQSVEIVPSPVFVTHFRVTSRGVGGSASSVVVLQSTWATKLDN
jgi:type IV pilus assembly protein PilX